MYYVFNHRIISEKHSCYVPPQCVYIIGSLLRLKSWTYLHLCIIEYISNQVNELAVNWIANEYKGHNTSLQKLPDKCKCEQQMQRKQTNGGKFAIPSFLNDTLNLGIVLLITLCGLRTTATTEEQPLIESSVANIMERVRERNN